MTRRELYEQYKESHRCVDCATQLTENYMKVRCERCLSLRRSYNRRKKENRNAKIVEHIIDKIDSGDKFVLDTRNTNRIIITTFSRDKTVLRSVSL